MITLLDVNLLIALGDHHHAHHAAAFSFFESEVIGTAWASCPLTENAFLRIFGHPAYPNGPGSPALARKVLLSILANPGHQFWRDDLSLTDLRTFPNLPAPKQLTDIYLLALAVKRGGRLATFDLTIDPSWVAGGNHALHLVPF